MGVLSVLRELLAPASVSPATHPPVGAPMPRQRALNGADGTPYDAAGYHSQELGDWFPWLGSPDLEINPYRDRIVARSRDLVRNDGWASGAVTSILDQAIGGDLRLRAMPDWKLLSLYNKSFDAVWADEFGRTAQALWRGFAYDPGRWCDGSRRLTVPQLFRLAFRHRLIDGEALAQLIYDPTRRRGNGYATCIQLIDPDRLGNPDMTYDQRQVRGGVEVDQLGAAVAYHIRRAHQGDWFDAAKAWEWDRIPRETADGRPVIVHDFDAERAAQHRAAGGIFTPVLARLKMLTRYDQVELQAAVINAIFAAYIESPYDPADVQGALEVEMRGGDARNAVDEMSMYQKMRGWWAEERPVRLNGARIPTLASGEKISTINASRPAAAFEAFESAMLRNVAAATGQGATQVTKDWTRMNYSSARAELLEAWKTLSRRRQDFTTGFCAPCYGAWLEEAMALGQLPVPAGAPEFGEARGAYSTCRFMGPGRGWVDPVKEAQAMVLRLDSMVTTYAQECADQGHDWEEQLAQRSIELKRMKELGIPTPEWAHNTPAAAIEMKPRPA